MSKIIFLAEPSVVRDITFTQIGDNQIQLEFSEDIPAEDILLSGLHIVNEHNGITMASREDYKHIYRTYEDSPNVIELCNDGVEYVEPEPVVIPEPEPVEPYVPTEEELQAQFEMRKSNQISTSKLMLESYLKNNPLHSACHNGVEGIYSITAEKQSLMANNYLTYTIAKQAGQEPVLTWNESGKECEVWTEEEYVQLILEASAYVKPLVAKQQTYEVEIKACTTHEELDAIVINYSL